jgi:hypothetical protein
MGWGPIGLRKEGLGKPDPLTGRFSKVEKRIVYRSKVLLEAILMVQKSRKGGRSFPSNDGKGARIPKGTKSTKR